MVLGFDSFSILFNHCSFQLLAVSSGVLVVFVGSLAGATSKVVGIHGNKLAMAVSPTSAL